MDLAPQNSAPAIQIGLWARTWLSLKSGQYTFFLVFEW